jgi:hypothetical protein
MKVKKLLKINTATCISISGCVGAQHNPIQKTEMVSASQLLPNAESKE